MVRYIRKRMHHHAWEAAVLRGSVEPGTELEAARKCIVGVLRRGGAIPHDNEVDITVIGGRAVAAFIFKLGSPGTLMFVKGRMNWCADEWP